MKKPVHNGHHKYERVSAPSGYEIYKCMMPGCSHYLPFLALAIGRLSHCWSCDGEVELTQEMVNKWKTVKPRCEKCKKERKLAIQALKDVPMIEEGQFFNQTKKEKQNDQRKLRKRIKTNQGDRLVAVLNVVQRFFPKVEQVIDANYRALIDVTQKDASSKAIKDHTGCAMAIACKRKFHLDGVIISRSVAYLIKGTRARRFKVPESISREVVSFDRGSGFTPGKYELAAVPNSMKQGYREGKPERPAKRDGKPSRPRHLTTNVRSVLGGQRPEDE